MNLQEYNTPAGLGSQLKIPVPGAPGCFMRIEDDLRKCVAFIGYEDDTQGKGGTHCIGTAFFLDYKHCGYLVTVKHIAKQVGDNPFEIRVNRKQRGSQNIHADEVIWYYHPDDSVDIAIIPIELPMQLFDVTYLSGTMILTDNKMQKDYVGIGDQCYTVGLFRLLSGEKRNLPVVYTGNIALVPGDEKIPVEDWDNNNKTKYIEAYVLNSQSIDGLSGSPVLVRYTIDIPVRVQENRTLRARVPSFQLALLGVWQSSWKVPVNELSGYDMTERIIAPVGMGVVVPASKIIEVLEMPSLQEQRQKTMQARERKNAATLDMTKPPKTPDNPQHKARRAGKRSASRLSHHSLYL